MTTGMIKNTRFLLPLSLTACLLQACLFQTQETKVAGGAEDFPNTVALGAAVSGNISDHAGWDQFSVIPSVLPSLAEADSLVIAPDEIDPGEIALAKGATRSALDTVTWDFSDTASLKIVRRFHFQDGLLKSHRDTAVFRYAGTGKNGLGSERLLLESKGSDTWKASGRQQGYRYENLDSTGGFDRATFTEHLPALGSAFKNKILVMLPGPDGDMATAEDNQPAFYSFALIKAGSGTEGDTTEFFSMQDADGDGTLWGAGDSGVVDFQQRNPHPLLRPSVDSVNQKMRAIMFKDESKTYPISFVEKRYEKDGKQLVFSVKGTRADSVCQPGDTAWISVRVNYAPESRIVEKHSRYRVVLGGEPKHYQDNQLLHFTMDLTWRKDSLSTMHFAFTPDQPVPSKELNLSGKLEVSAEFANGDQVEGRGRFVDKRIDADLTLTLAGGLVRRFQTQWDALGKLLSQVPAP